MSARTLRGLAFGACIALAATDPVSAWEPDRFEVYCGKPARDSADVLERYYDGQEKDPNTWAYYLDHFGEDADIPDDSGCLSPHRKELLEDYARRSLLALKGMGFASPSPNRLGPVVRGSDGKKAVRLFVDREFVRSMAATNTPCVGSDGRRSDPLRLSLMTLSTHYFENSPPPVLLRLIAHEMTHVIQYAQPFQIQVDDCGGTAQWLREGTADAIGAHVAEQRFPNYRPPLSVRGSKSFYGLRPYNKAFTWASGGGGKKDKYGFPIITAYRTSSLFMHLADHYYGGKYDYLSNFFAVPDSKKGGDDWLNWLDSRLRNKGEGGPGIPLYLVFPDFIANYATWGTKKYGHIGESEWLAESFDRCHTVELTRKLPSRKVSLELEPISAQCLRVFTQDLTAGEVAQVKLMAYGDSEEEVDNLHLGVAYMSAKVLEFGGKEMNCFDVAKQHRKKPVCITKPFTGRKGAGKDRGVTEQATSGGWVKTWSSVTQESTGGLLDNLYVITHTPVDPSDAKHDNRDKQKVRLEVALDVQKFSTTTHGTATKVTASINNNLTEPVPMTGGEGTFAGLAAAAGGDPEALSKLPFLMNMPSLPVPGMAPGDGISSVTLSAAKVKSDPYGGAELEPTLQMVLIPDGQAIPFGSTGRFRASVMGYDQEAIEGAGSNPMAMLTAIMNNLSKDEPSGTIEVVEWSDALLRIRVQGNYCRVVDWDARNRRCRRPQSFSGEVIKPFGWAYDTTRPFVSVDTPGMVLYRKRLYDTMREDMGIPLPPMPETTDNPPGPADSDSSTPGSGPAGSTAGRACDCSCKAFERMKDVGGKINNKGNQRPTPGMMALARCSMQCMGQWASCARRR